MPLRVTVELIPFGNEAQKKTIGVMNITNIGGIRSCPNYEVQEMLADTRGILGYTVREVLRDELNVFTFLQRLFNKRHEGIARRKEDETI